MQSSEEYVQYPGYIEFQDEDGIEQSFCCGILSFDGVGETCTYNHVITGGQHVVTVFSLVTRQLIYVKHDQVTCIYCQHQMTKLFAQKGLVEITAEVIKHPGKVCYQNSKHGPAMLKGVLL